MSKHHASQHGEPQRQRNVVVGVTGGIAAYKACHLIRYFKERGDAVRVVPTEAACRFVGPATFEALSGQPVDTGVFEAVDEVQHVRIGQEADLIVVAPATADFLAKAAAGMANDLLTATLLVARCPVLLAPAMHTEMLEHPATQANISTLRSRGVIVLEPARGRLTGTDTGAGRLPEPEQIGVLANAAAAGVKFPRDLEGVNVLITAGGTQEPIDPVRFVGNHSSGRQGFALAEVAVQRGARVSLVGAHTDALPTPPGATVVRVSSAREMQQACEKLADQMDVAIMAAAVADYRPASTAASKLKKGQADGELAALEMTENPDILRGLVARRSKADAPGVIVGFAAETGDSTHSALDYARVKLEQKGCDLLMCNDVAEGKVFGQGTNAGVLLWRNGEQREVPQGSKVEVAAAILDAVVELRATA